MLKYKQSSLRNHIITLFWSLSPIVQKVKFRTGWEFDRFNGDMSDVSIKDSTF